MTYTLIPQLWYTITPATDCDVSTPNGISIHLPAGIQYFHFADGTSIDIAGEATVTQNPPLFKPASASALGGGYIESDLNVGHGAAAAEKAVCTLTLGDPTDKGDLTDNAEHELHLDAQPALQSHGVLTVADATEGGTLTIGETELPAFAEKKETPASISLALLVDVSELHGDYEFGLQYNGELWCTFATYITDTTGEAFAEELGNAERWNLPDGTALGFAPVEATWDSTTEKITMVSTAKQGVDSDNVAVEDGPMCPFIVSQDERDFSGGQDARTMEEAVNMVALAIDAATGEDVETVIDYEANTVTVIAAEPGAAGDLLAFTVTGDLLEITEQMDGGQDARTYAEVIAAINGDDGEGEPTYPFGAKAEATETEGVITLTANDAGADANSITYTATGCFGGGTVKQGSATRGKNAVTQTAFKIYLNGAELDVEPAPLPSALTPTTAMKNGGVYTVAAAGTELNFSAVRLEVNATAEVWVTCTAITSVTWPTGWIWLEGSAPTFASGKSYGVALRNDGTATLAHVAYEYSTPAQS